MHCSSGFRGSRSHRRLGREIRPGDCVRLLKHPGGLAFVDTLEHEVDSVAVVASFMQEQDLHRFRLRNRFTHCWHMVYLLSLCSCMNSQSCDCERIGSHLHQVEDGGTVRSPARVADRLRFKVSGVKGIGSVRDEALIRTLVQTLLLAKKRPFVHTKQRAVRRRSGDPTCGHLGSRLLIQDSDNRAADQPGFDDDEEDIDAGSGSGSRSASRLQETLANFQLAFKVHKEQHAPTQLAKLDPQSQSELQKVLWGAGGRQDIKALPAFVKKGPKATTKAVPVSTSRQQMAEWMQSAEGQAFKKQRDELSSALFWFNVLRF